MISVVIPVYNESTNIDTLVQRCSATLSNSRHDHELIFVDDGSTDATLEKLKQIAADDDRVKILSLSRNFGHQHAVTAGLDHAQGDAVIIMDGDLQDPPELIPELIAQWENGYQVVYARRKKRQGDGILKKWTAFVFYRLFRILTTTEIPVDTGDFRLLDRVVVDSLSAMKERNRFLRGMVSWAGFRQTGVDFDRQERLSDKTKYPMTKMIRFALDAVFSFSYKPLKIATFLGAVSAAIGFVMILWGLYSKFFMPETTVKGWASVFIAVLFLGGVQLFAIGIIGEYISRIYDESKGRPLYIVSEKINLEARFGGGSTC